MARFGFFSLPLIGHLNPMAALSQELERRGHETSFFNIPELGEAAQARRCRFVEFGAKTCPLGSMTAGFKRLTRLSGPEADCAGLAVSDRYAEAVFAEAGPIVAEACIDVWLVDQFDYSAASLAAYFKKPLVTLAVALLRNHEDGVPGFSGELPSADSESRQRDQLANEKLLELSRPHRERVSWHRQAMGLSPFRYEDVWSKLAQISQQPAEFEFPRRELPECFHFTGPFIDEASHPRVDFPWERLDRRPLIYASLGTLKSNYELLRKVCEALEGADMQLVVSLGGEEPLEAPQLPGGPLAVRFAPQLKLLERADLMVTHAGMNSSLECLAYGVPMVVLPLAHDQFGIAARVEWSGVGVRVQPEERTVERLKESIQTIFGTPKYREAAQDFARLIRDRNGLSRAADIVEQVARTGQPVLRGD
ncbi:MAG: glycosyltransferase [Acidobacteria bacterium]|nr:glycosyltransferase [Acidobacteriota bacterium]